MDSCRVMCMEQAPASERQQGKGTGNELELETSTFSTRTPQTNTSNSQATKFAPANNSSSSPNMELAGEGSKVIRQQASVPAKKPFDVVIFAASSSVGRFLVEELALVVNKFYSSSNQATQQTSSSGSPLQDQPSGSQISISQPTSSRKLSVPRQVDGVKWAVAGRSAMRLNETLCRAELSTGIKELSSKIPVLLADLNHHKSLLDMCAKTHLVINCAGPYSAHGETVIKACLETRTNYIDLSHETSFIERMRRDYNERARKIGIYIINGCGFQSMSSEMGLNFMKQVSDGQIEEVKIILNLNDTKALVRHSGSQMYQRGIVSPGMWSSLITDKSNSVPLGAPIVQDSIQTAHAVRRQDSEDGDPNQRKTLLRKDTQTLVRDVVQFRNRNSFAWLQLFRGIDQAGKGYCLPMNAITSEESQLIRGEMTNYELRKPDLDSTDGWRPIRCSSFLSAQTLGEVILLVVWFFIFNFLVRLSIPRRLMKTFPTLFSLGNVNASKGRELDRDSLNHIKFCQTYLAYGTPGDDSGDPMEQREKHLKRKQELILVSRVVGPEPNHVATASYAIQAALTVLVESDHLPDNGGVMTPGAAFSETNIIYQLRRRNIKFEVLKKA